MSAKSVITLLAGLAFRTLFQFRLKSWACFFLFYSSLQKLVVHVCLGRDVQPMVSLGYCVHPFVARGRQNLSSEKPWHCPRDTLHRYTFLFFYKALNFFFFSEI